MLIIKSNKIIFKQTNINQIKQDQTKIMYKLKQIETN